MTKKIFKGIILVSLLTLIAGLILISGVLYEYFGNRLSTELESEAAYVAQGIEQMGEQYFDGLDTSKNRITWIDADGTVLYDSKADVETMENHANREEVVEAFETGTGEAVRYSKTLSEQTIYYAILLDNGTVARVSSTQYTVWVLLLGVVQPMIVILVFAIVLSAILASLVSKRIVKPINAIDLSNPDIDEPYEELSPLLRNMNRQNRMIQQQMDELRRKQEEFSMITENMNEGFLIVDGKTDILSYNSSALKLLGAEGDVDKKSVLTVNRSGSFRKAVELALAGQHNNQLMQVNNRYYHIIANPVMNEKQISGAVIIIIDVTEKEQREVLRREFTSNVSHELKTPLTSISGVAEFMMNGIDRAEDIPVFAQNIYDEAGRLITLLLTISSMLSQLDENSVPLEREMVDLYETVKRVAGRLEGRPN
jgi:two-component system phosphate regulon sensor histidine kinase PhoR